MLGNSMVTSSLVIYMSSVFIFKDLLKWLQKLKIVMTIIIITVIIIIMYIIIKNLGHRQKQSKMLR